MLGIKKKIILGFTFLGIWLGTGICFLQSPIKVEASTFKIKVANNESKEVNVHVEDYLEFKPEEIDYQYTYYSNEIGKTIFPFGNGKFWVSDAGEATIIISGKDKEGKDSFIADYKIIIGKEKSKSKIVEDSPINIDNTTPNEANKTENTVPMTVDMSSVTMQTKELKISRTLIKTNENRTNGFEVMINSPVPLVQDKNAILSYQNANGKMKYAITLDGSLKINVTGSGNDVLLVAINGKDFIFNVEIIEESLSETTVVLAKEDSYQLILNGILGKPVVWKSSNESVAVVNENGLVTAMGNGNSVITATVEEKKFVAVVSVTTQLKRDVANFTKNYSSASKYSQPKRMNEGFYDCSSLVWRAYHKFGHDIILKTYAPVAAAMGKYYTDTNKLIEGGVSRENIDAMVFEPGDLLFLEGTKKNGRYKNIHHVEMIYGYSVEGLDAEGKPILGIRYANNPQSNFKGFVGRPNPEENEIAQNRY